ncbi:MAG: M48 family metalloprotease [Bryobacteraceae bacterium]|nr:M48 family metalloprotease [Bryobacteraceae bacterium]
MVRKLFGVLWLAGRLLAQDEDDDNGKLAYVDLRLDSSGHGELTVSFTGVTGLDRFLTPALQAALTRPLRCEQVSLSGQTLRAFCPQQLSLVGANLAGAIRMDALFQPLFDLGIDDVVAFIHVPDAAANPTTPEAANWSQVLREGSGLRYGHRSGARHYLPATLQIEYPARHQGGGEMRSTLLAICGIIFLPAFVAFALARRATSALADDEEAAIGEEALWVDLLVQFLTLVWIGLLSSLEMRDLAHSLFPGEPLAGALFGFLLIVLPPVLGGMNCLGVWFPVLERAGLTGGLSFGRALVVHAVHHARLLVPTAMLGIAIEVFPKSFSGGLLALAVTGVVSLVLAILGSEGTFRNAQPLRGGELWERAQALAAAARVRLRRVWILDPATPANAYALPGKQIALSPAFLSTLDKPQVDAIIAHELAHIRHNDFKNSTLVYMAYLAVGAPLLHAYFSHWILVPQSLVILLLLGVLSRHAEYRADRLAGELVSPEAAVRALARITRQGRQPVTLNPFTEVLLSHPSLENRVRAIAYDHQQTTDWLRRILLDEWENRPAATELYRLAEPVKPVLVET